MFAKQLTASFIVLLCGLSAIAVTDDESRCSSVKKEYIGDKKQVLVEVNYCGTRLDSFGDSKMAVDSGKDHTKVDPKKSMNVCGAQCDSVCYEKKQPPYYLPSDCQVIYDAI
ncbi:hypothetical protein MPER_00105, partial [Moniliophthora perniciosa FA553]